MVRSGVRVRVWRARVGVMVRFYFAVGLHSFFTMKIFHNFCTFCIVQMRNKNCVRIRVRVRGLGLRSGLRLALRSSLYFYFVEVLCCFRYFTHSTPIFCNISLPIPAGGMKRQLHLLRALVICYNTGVMTYCCWMLTIGWYFHEYILEFILQDLHRE